jgi:uncharacterized protein YutE (UPF0331/DUF86 family)
MGNSKNSKLLKQDVLDTGSKLSDRIAKDCGYNGNGSGKALAEDLYKVGAISEETKDAIIEGVDKRNDIGHPYGKQKTDVNTNISETDVTKFSNAVNEIEKITSNDLDITF